MSIFSKLLAPTDFSAEARAGVERAFGLVGSGGEVIVLHVVDDIPLTYGYVGMSIPDPQVMSRIMAGAEEELAASVPPAPPGVRVIKRVERGSPFEVIVKMAEEEAVDAIVMGTHGRSGLKHALIGSVTEKVVRKSPCPVLVSPPTAQVP